MMYEALKNGVPIALMETPNYIRKHPDGFLVLCEEDAAQGVAINGTPYRLFARDGLEELEEVLLVARDSGSVLYQQAENAEKLKTDLESAQSAASISFVALAESGGLDAVTASEHAELFAEWAYPVAYTVGQLRRYNGRLYKCVQAHTSQADWTPDTAASLWSVAADPAEEWPAWSQPVGAHDAYAKGAKVSHNGKHWTSSVDSNVWEPGVYGWTEATE